MRSVSTWLSALLLIGAALAASLLPEMFLLDREALGAGEVWRLWTGHLVHRTAVHFAFDVGVAVGLLFLVRRTWIWLVLPPFVGVVALLARPDLSSYAGLSGVLHGLTVLSAGTMWRENRGTERWIAAVLWCAVTGKAFTELALGMPLFSGGYDMGGETVFAAHVAGVLGGTLWLLLGRGGTLRCRSSGSGAGREDLREHPPRCVQQVQVGRVGLGHARTPG